MWYWLLEKVTFVPGEKGDNLTVSKKQKYCATLVYSTVVTGQGQNWYDLERRNDRDQYFRRKPMQ